MERVRPISPHLQLDTRTMRGFADGLRRLPALNLPYNSLSTVRGQTGILVHVHPVLPWKLKSRNLSFLGQNWLDNLLKAHI
jgi:hypothetical protein